MTTIARTVNEDEVVGGVDTHAETHTAAVIDATGRLLADRTFPADAAGYRDLAEWMRGFGPLALVGIEGTGVYGSGLAEHLRREQVRLVEVDRPDRKTRRFAGKSDPIDALAAARAALSQAASGTPKVRDGRIEAIRALRVARRSAIDQRADCQRRIKTLLVTAPESLRAQLRGLGNRRLLATCAALRPDTDQPGTPTQAHKIAMRSLARRHAALTTEIDDLDGLIAPLVAAANPDLLALTGIGPDVAGQLLVTAGENTDRLHSEAAFAMLCGAAPIPASSGRTHRHRLNRGGDRHANAALYRIVLCRLRWDPRTQAYMRRRTQEGLSTKDVIRCLKRLIAREVYYVITRAPTAA